MQLAMAGDGTVEDERHIMRILAVDDDPVFLELLCSMLAAEGYPQVTAAKDGAEALQLLDQSKTPFDCLLLDIQMPGMSGVELCAAVRKRNAYRNTPIVMITAMSGKRFIDDAFGVGASDYVVKPLDRRELKARMGMVAQLRAERKRIASLTEQVRMANVKADPKLDFEAPTLIDGIDRAVEFLALENYLLLLSKNVLNSVSAFGIEIENAGLIFGRAPNSSFLDVLGDVASVLFDALKTEDVMLSYAGSGKFVCIVRSPLTVDIEEIEEAVELGLESFADIYKSDGLPVPKVVLSDEVRSSFFGMMRPTRLLDQALQMPKRPKDAAAAWWSRVA